MVLTYYLVLVFMSASFCAFQIPFQLAENTYESHTHMHAYNKSLSQEQTKSGLFFFFFGSSWWFKLSRPWPGVELQLDVRKVGGSKLQVLFTGL